ncbi:MAG: hypothetical protein ABI763_12740 [Bacteroidota bacterium]
MKPSAIPRQYVLDENNRKIAVMIDIKTFDKIEEAIENYGLMQFIKANAKDKPIIASEAKSHYRKIKKSG